VHRVRSDVFVKEPCKEKRPLENRGGKGNLALDLKARAGTGRALSDTLICAGTPLRGGGTPLVEKNRVAALTERGISRSPRRKPDNGS